MLCGISNQVATDPVVSKVSGCIFERRLIEAYVAEHGRCPVTGEAMEMKDVVPVARASFSTTSAAMSGLGAATIPSLLERLHGEWDATMMEQFSLRQQLTQMQQELAHALDKYEAACRVIATMTKEREEMRQQLHAAGITLDAASLEDGRTLAACPAAVAEVINMHEKHARQARSQHNKKCSVQHTEVQALGHDLSMTHHFSVGRGASALCVAFDGHDEQSGAKAVFAAGTGSSHGIVHYDVEADRVVAMGLGHTAAVHTLITTTQANRLISASADSTVKVWESCHSDDAQQKHQRRRVEASEEVGELICRRTLRLPGGISCMAHEMIGDRYILTCGAAEQSGCISLSDLEVGEVLMSSSSNNNNAHHNNMQALELHPFASLAATGTQGGELLLWDVRQLAIDVVSRPLGLHKEALVSIHFAADATTVATGWRDGRCVVLDLRKMDVPLATIAAPSSSSSPAVVSFHPLHRSMLAVVGADVRLFDLQRVLKPSVDANTSQPTPELRCVVEDGSIAPARGVAFAHAEKLQFATAALDGVVRLYE